VARNQLVRSMADLDAWTGGFADGARRDAQLTNRCKPLTVDSDP